MTSTHWDTLPGRCAALTRPLTRLPRPAFTSVRLGRSTRPRAEDDARQGHHDGPEAVSSRAALPRALGALSSRPSDRHREPSSSPLAAPSCASSVAPAPSSRVTSRSALDGGVRSARLGAGAGHTYMCEGGVMGGTLTLTAWSLCLVCELLFHKSESIRGRFDAILSLKKANLIQCLRGNEAHNGP